MKKNSTLKIENARIGFRNFAGAASTYNKAGDRNFVIFLEHDLAKELEADGWNIKWPKIDPDKDIKRDPHLPVSLKFNVVPPKVVLINGNTQTRMTEDTVSALDYAEIENVDIIINPYHWEVNGKTGVKAYVKTMYVTLVVDEFYDKYNKEDDDVENQLPWN